MIWAGRDAGFFYINRFNVKLSRCWNCVSKSLTLAGLELIMVYQQILSGLVRRCVNLMFVDDEGTYMKLYSVFTDELDLL